MKELFTLLAPVLWSTKNDLIRFNWSFYRKLLFYSVSSCIFIFLMANLLNFGMTKLQRLSPEVFHFLLLKGYGLIFMIIFFIQIINGIIISLNTFYQSKELEVLITSPVNRTFLFFSRLFDTHVKTSWMLIIFGIPLLISLGIFFHTNFIFYGYSLLLFIVFSTIPVNIGIGLTMFLSSIFHVRRMKKFLFSAGFILAIVLITLLRIFRPERFVNPELFANLTLFITEIKAPFFILMPNRWISEAIFDVLNKGVDINTLIFIPLLFLTSYVTAVMLLAVFKRFHYRGWALLQEGGIVHIKDKGLKDIQFEPFTARISGSGKINPVLRIIGSQSRTFIKKDFLCQIRDEKNIHQIVILLALIIIYLFSISALPLNWEYYAVQLKYLISFFNLGLILVIIASLCSRLIYPSVVNEGASLWITKTSPVTPKKYIWTKFLFFFVPVFIVAQMLTVVSSLLIGIEKNFIFLKITTVTLLSLSFVSLAISFGISDLKHVISETSQEKLRTGNTTYMLLSVFLILFTLAIEIVPTFLYFLKEAQKSIFTQKAWIVVGAALFIVLIMNTVITALAIRHGIRKIEQFW
jgi:ABC-2 type transport system permease protein